MQAYIVANMGQKRAMRPHSTGKSYSIVDKLMGMMRLVEAQCIDHQRFHSIEQGLILGIDGLHIGNIGKAPKAIAQNGKLPVHHLKRNDADIANLKGVAGFDFVQSDSRHARIAMLGKAVGKHLQHRLAGQAIGIYIDFAELAVRANIVHATHVVVVGVGNENAVDAAERLRKNLLTKVGAAVNEQSRLLSFHQYGAAQAFVLRVAALADTALAAYHRHTTRGTRSKKCDFHLYNIDFRIDFYSKLLQHVLAYLLAEADYLDRKSVV